MVTTARSDSHEAGVAGVAATRTSVIIPALDDGATIAGVVADLRGAAAWHEIIVVDDGSRDDTPGRAAAAGARVIRHPCRRGNGAAVKSGIRSATGEFVLIADGLGQTRSADAMRLVSHLSLYELVVGTRLVGTWVPWTHRIGDAMLGMLASHLAGRRIPDLASGFRAAHRDCLLEFFHLLPDGVSIPTTTTLAFLKAGYSVLFVPLDTGQGPGSSTIRPGLDDAHFFLVLLKIMTIFSPLKIFAPVSAAAFVTGAAYAVWTIATQSHVTNSSVLLILLSVVIFLVGLVSEQISALRFEGRRR